jgi:nitrogen fixation protein NifU and related proteins
MKDSMESFMGSIYRRIGKTECEAPHRGNMGNRSPRDTLRRMEAASCRGKVTGKCGESMEIGLKIQGEWVEDAAFITDGCQFSVICGYLATQLSKGKTVDEVIQIGGDTILMLFDKLPKSEIHCAYLAAEALHTAIHEWMLK